MSKIFSHTISLTNSSSFRVGTKWDPLERDALQDTFAIDRENSQKELETLLSQIKLLWWIRKFLRYTFFFRNYGRSLGKMVDHKQNKIDKLKKYLAHEGLDSYDLDLCCCCYDRNGNFVRFISPRTIETRDMLQVPMAFMHSGDDETGTGDMYDEEMKVNLSAIDPVIHHVFFVTASINHGFDEIKGWFWSFINTQDEKEILSAETSTKTSHRLHVMAKLARKDFAWSLTEIAEYVPLEIEEKATLGDKIDVLVRQRYLAPSGAKAL